MLHLRFGTTPVLSRPRVRGVIPAVLALSLGLTAAANGGEGPGERSAGYGPSDSSTATADATATPATVGKELAAAEPDGKPEAGRWAEDVETARVTAAATDRPLVLHFHAEWCRPCQKMETDVLGKPDVLAQLGGDGVVGVKVDVDEHEDLAEEYGVTALPADVFLQSDGTLLTRAVGPTDVAGYAGRLSRVAAHLPATDAADLLECPKCEPGDPAELLEEWARRRGPGYIELGLKGYCPVSLVDGKVWEKGEAKYAWSVGGVAYRLKDAAALAKFRANPCRYAPQLSGYDPHLLSTTARAVPGRAEFAAFYEGQLYLHATEASRRAFIADPAGHILPQRIYPSAADFAAAPAAVEAAADEPMGT
ncbi:thioredoxin family protein [Alienimonas californiensis]|uniref:Thiol:disulfide interchange protein DsbD n=1 Tax=Alienimonas californiensis TaxID=2527989 RepID=A0A517P3I7_9PLAN|nr:thioredoxin family protein [Alienimonas californiensis]QDT13940.1 Thiol:disulfide interchange protein DsbD precursor [Alienimonas californiensis]